ncbi:hypothetical protein EZ449_14165 [Pedobacter frigidisoli]|uniref:Methylamine utilisation protein MauE domain-containing protein n=1 Tax=Pedobacter frigidisoli TaxID=2530455 RepID=A0A4V2MMP5_9SPHI|nr:MauE/DoxX family redox-associated membrane protein [Pedobacter frigidisoli]TCD07676.1 hypothetical protein EZ449_14165 [Pedobacter frigidisoli]
MIKKYLWTRERLSDICAALLVFLFSYAAISKLMSYNISRKEMLNQVFLHDTAIVLTWLIPVIEFCITIMLLFPQLRKLSFLSALTLLSTFSFYITISMSGIFGRIPCSCGGILGQMSYGIHLLFNTFFMAIAVLGMKISAKKTKRKIRSYQTNGREEHAQIL